jgi:hypothetical protein
MELMKGCCLEVNELGGWILEGGCQIFKKNWGYGLNWIEKEKVKDKEVGGTVGL